MTFRRSRLVCLVVLCATLASLSMEGQSLKATAEASGPADPAKAADVLVSGAETDFISIIEAMPADKFDFAPSAEIFKQGRDVDFQGVRTFAQLVTHTIQANYFLWAKASGLKPEVDLARIPKLTNKDDIVAAAKASMAFGHKAAASITSANAFDSQPAPAGSRFGGIAFGVIHIRDEYGQMVEYLRMNGIAPPASKGKPLAKPVQKM
jgi:hypothetical protein